MASDRRSPRGKSLFHGHRRGSCGFDRRASLALLGSAVSRWLSDQIGPDLLARHGFGLLRGCTLGAVDANEHARNVDLFPVGIRALLSLWSGGGRRLRPIGADDAVGESPDPVDLDVDLVARMQRFGAAG